MNAHKYSPAIIFFSLVVCFITLSAFLQAQGSIPIQSKIAGVTVFLKNAQIIRTGSVSLKPGNQIFFFGNLPSSINPQSVQVEGEGNFTILSVTSQLNYLQAPAKTAQIQQLQDSLILLQDLMSSKKAALNVCDEEESFLKANKSIGGNNTGVNVNDLKLAAEYLRTRLTEIGKSRILINREVIQIGDKISRISNQLNSLSATNQPVSEVLVMVTAPAATNASFRLSYLVSDAGWTPEYDLRATDVNKPVELTYKGSITQTTGESWDHVRLKLSTGNPSLGGTKPELQPWFLDFYAPIRDRKLKSFVPASKGEGQSVMEEKSLDELAVTAYASTGADFTTVTENQTTTEYEIGIPADVPADGKPHQVEIRRESLPATYVYYAAPKLDPDAFLVACVTGWENLNLLSGPMNLYCEDTYMGQSQLDATATKDTLDISLGRDKGINIHRERMKEFTSRQIIGGNRKDVRGFAISVKNRKKQDVTLILEDQIPVSTNKEITVDPTEISGASLDKNTGKVTWKLPLQSAGSVTLKMIYEVKYPKDKQIILE